jgi:hypothetical protein
MKAVPWPEGRKTKTASGFSSRVFCSTGEKSGLRSGVRSLSITVPPPAANRSANHFSASMPGP